MPKTKMLRMKTPEDENTQDEKCQDQNSGMNRYVKMKMSG